MFGCGDIIFIFKNAERNCIGSTSCGMLLTCRNTSTEFSEGLEETRTETGLSKNRKT